MRDEFPIQVERSRTEYLPFYPKTAPHAKNGIFKIWRRKEIFLVLISDGMGWDHVSASLETRCPDWKEMCWLKNLFFDEDEAVLQFHPPTKDYINMAKNCLHLWRPHAGMELPDPVMVGFK